MADARIYVPSILATIDTFDLNTLAETTLFTCPAGYICIITEVVMRTPSAAIGTASISFGWNTANADDVIANGVRTLTGVTNYEIIPAASDAVRGVAAGTFKVEVQTQEGAGDTCSFDVIGYLVAA